MPFEFGTKGDKTRESEAIDYFEKYSGKPRDFRNGVGLAVPAEEQPEALRRSVRYLVAIEQVRSKARQLNLADAQKDQLKEREATERAAAESALLKLYSEVWLPRVDNGGIAIESIAVGGRPLQTTLDERKRALIHQRVMELLTNVQPRVFGTLNPSKIIDLFKLGDGSPPLLGTRTAEVVSGFYSFLGFTRLTSDAAIRRAIVQGVEKRLFGYTTGAPKLGEDGHYQIDRAKVVYDQPLAEDEVDLQSGFLIVPSALPVVAAPPPGAGPEPPAPRESGPALPGPPPLGGEGPNVPGPGLQRLVELAFSADRNQLFTAWNALANLADMAGKVTVTVHASSDAGFDQGKLENGVLEPLRETKLID
jgi:hypothetical protein